MDRDAIDTVRAHYDADPQTEWDRLAQHPIEFELTTYMMDRYIRPGDSVLDIGGGPGRYSIYYAQKGCAVTLAELSGGNVALAQEKAAEAGVSLTARTANCLELDALALGQFDHVFLMGPLYHLQNAADRKAAVDIALRHLKPGGKLYVSFISVFAGLIYDLQHEGQIVPDMAVPDCIRLVDNACKGEDYTGPGFTAVHFFHPRNIGPFMAQFPMEPLHLFPQEGFLSPNSVELSARSPEEMAQWITLSKQLLEVPELLSWGEHIMYIGQKKAT